MGLFGIEGPLSLPGFQPANYLLDEVFNRRRAILSGFKGKPRVEGCGLSVLGCKCWSTSHTLLEEGDCSSLLLASLKRPCSLAPASLDTLLSVLGYYFRHSAISFWVEV